MTTDAAAVASIEAATRELHPVPGVAGEADDDRFELLHGLRGHATVVAQSGSYRSRSSSSWSAAKL